MEFGNEMREAQSAVCSCFRVYDGLDIFLRDTIGMCRPLCAGPLVVLVEDMAACPFPRAIGNCEEVLADMRGPTVYALMQHCDASRVAWHTTQALPCAWARPQS